MSSPGVYAVAEHCIFSCKTAHDKLLVCFCNTSMLMYVACMCPACCRWLFGTWPTAPAVAALQVALDLQLVLLLLVVVVAEGRLH
jgi:hypothetical protein